MKTVFDKTTQDELIYRIKSVNSNCTAQWGKMNVYQMLKHCTMWDEWITGNSNTYKQHWLGRIIGGWALKGVLKDEKPLRKNSPTIPDFIVKEEGDIEAEKVKWISLMEGYVNFSKNTIQHPFFGKMTKEQVGYLAYKHADHHLRQFNS